MMSLLHWQCRLFVSALILMASVSARADELPGFPVLLGRGNAVKGFTVADLDGDGKPALVVVAGETVQILGVDGKPRPGYPLSLRDAGSTVPAVFPAAPAICDLNGDGKGEVVLAGSTAKLYALTGAGAFVSGFPVPLESPVRAAVSCAPVKGSKREDVVFTTDAGALVVVAGTGGAPRMVAKVGRGAEGGVAVADLNGDGAVEYVAGGGDSRLYAFTQAGEPLKGFPYKMSFRTNGTPAIGDVDDDGRPDIIFGSQDFKIHALGNDGKPLAGFPVDTSYRIYAGVALSDLNGDGVLDLVVGSGDKSLYALDGHGQKLKGFPLATVGRLDFDAAIADLDRDANPEILVVADEGTLYQITATGKKSSLEVGDRAVGAPAAVDLDQDGIPEIIVATAKPALHVLKGEANGKAEVALADWPMAGHDAKHSGRHAPNPGRFKELGFAKLEPLTTDSLVAAYRFFDLDGEPEQQSQIRWYRNNAHEPRFDNKAEIPPSETTKHERWHYTLQEGANFKAYGDKGVLSRVYRSVDVEVQNTAPESPVISLTPATPTTTASLEIAITTPSKDADNDPLTYRYIWLKDDRPQKLDVTTTRIAPELTQKRETWQVIVVPFDGEVEGATATALVTIINTPPRAFVAALNPAQARIDDVLKVEITSPAPDDDHDVVGYRQRYWVDGVPLDLPATEARVPARTLYKHQTLKVEVTAHDDQEAGAKTTLELRVQNTPPPAPVVAIWPATPKTHDDLQLGVLTQPFDADHDLVTLRHAWFVDGVPANFPTTVPKEQTKKGQVWKLVVTPFDGEIEGVPATVETRIVNTPPTLPEVVLPRYSFATDEEVVPRISTASKDDDGDVVRLRYLWKKQDKPAVFLDSKSSLAPADTTKGDKWEVQIFGNDGEADGPAATLRFVIVNSPPTAPAVAVSMPNPTVRDRVDVRIVTPATDKDVDVLSYRYRFFRDDVWVSTWPLTKNVLEPGEAKKGQHWRIEVRAFDGEIEGEPGMAELWVRNHVPAPPAIAMTPATPRTTDELTCQISLPGSDPDQDALSYRTRFFVDGQPLPMAQDVAKVPASLTKKGQRWECEMTAFDGDLVSAVARSTSVTIANTPPTSPQVSVTPAAPVTTDELVCEVARPSSDADLDLLSYRFAWRVDGKPYTAPSGGTVLPSNRVHADATRRGQIWECEVVASDGIAQAAAVTARVTVQNSPPTAPRVRIKPERPASGQELSCEIVSLARDLDDDSVQYRYAWLKDGVPQSFSPSSTNVPGRLVKARDIWACQVTPADSTVAGSLGQSLDVMVRK